MLPETHFSVAILVGGRSTRMGRDKAGIEIGGCTLLARQIALAWSLEPAEVLVSGRSDVPLGDRLVRVVDDERPGLGPLGGLASVLISAVEPHLLLLAVDLPALNAGMLHRLLAKRRAGVGVVPRTPRGWEPTAAVYPRSLLPEIRRRLAAGELALHKFVEAEVEAGRLVALDVPETDAAVFENWNTPADIHANL